MKQIAENTLGNKTIVAILSIFNGRKIGFSMGYRQILGPKGWEGGPKEIHALYQPNHTLLFSKWLGFGIVIDKTLIEAHTRKIVFSLVKFFLLTVKTF